jgi:CCR4-NOT transcription complex subunit 1
MIANLFDEYKFYPRYPEMQLKIAGVVFGKFFFFGTVNEEI